MNIHTLITECSHPTHGIDRQQRTGPARCSHSLRHSSGIGVGLNRACELCVTDREIDNKKQQNNNKSLSSFFILHSSLFRSTVPLLPCMPLWFICPFSGLLYHFFFFLISVDRRTTPQNRIDLSEKNFIRWL